MPREDNLETIYAYVRSIPPGRVASYGDVGYAVGVTARTVGWAMTVVVDATDTPVPWHRVVGSDGYLRIARRSAEAKNLQQSLLEAEGIVLKNGNTVPRKYFLGDDEDQ
jgi:methylated-DNA-protein-cysteine methyltransferase-like protein